MSERRRRRLGPGERVSPGTPQRTIRIPDDEWYPAMEAAEAQDEILSEEIRRFVRIYRRRYDRKVSRLARRAMLNDSDSE